MADKSITDLNVVPGSIDDSNTWFAVAQSGAAYKVSGHDFILALTVILDGHGGIKSITGPTTVGLVDTYTITFADNSTTDFEVTNGKGITGISKTGTSGLVDTYTISYNDGSTSTFTVTNGAKGDTGDSWYVWIRYSGSQPTQDSDMGTEPDNWMGIYSGTSSTAPVHYTDYDWFQIKGEQGDKGDAATIVSQSVTYQEGTSPNVQPSGTWTTTIPVVSQGNYLWTRTIVTFNSGNPVTFFSVARMGLDGTGSVSSVNNQSPDTNGNVTVTASDIGTSDSTSVQAELNSQKNTLDQLETTVDGTENGLFIYNDHGDDALYNIPAGYYVYVKGHGLLPEGLYQNQSGSQISQGVTLGSNLTSVSGALNHMPMINTATAQFTEEESLSSGVVKQFTAPRDGFYYVEATVTGTAGTAFAGIYANSNRTVPISVSSNYTGTWATVMTPLVPLKKGSTIYAYADFTGVGKIRCASF